MCSLKTALVVSMPYDWKHWDQFLFTSKKFSFKSCAILYDVDPFSQAVRSSLYGRPGPSYIEIPGNMVSDSISVGRVR